ncbi:acidic mammalian chitinase-like [Liolophura sinensis]|uniref:acidic mammalian chitinase-like n=1 Tax=Liolophura sinensis TaxID=3198878 RepID=UPI0031585271
MFCYYESSANARPSIGKFWPENIDPFLCTHVIFAFVDVTEDGRDLKPNNWNDLGEDGLYARTLALKKKNPKLKILASVGGWRIGSKPFIPMMDSDDNIRVWVKNCVKYLRQYGFDGLDMDWEFPATRGSKADDKYKFTLLMKELYGAFANEAKETGKEKLILAWAAASSIFYISKSYEPEKVVNYIDYLLLMTYNYHGSGWEMHTGHPSPLWAHRLDPPGEQAELNQQFSIDYWIKAGCPKEKIMVGIPTFSQTWLLTDPKKHGIRESAEGGYTKGKYTGEQGILSYYEVCELVQKEGWEVEWIEDQDVPYAHGSDGGWAGFENPDSLTIKANNIIARGLGGAFMWSLEMDDFTGSCGDGKYPLVSTVKKILKPVYDSDDKEYKGFGAQKKPATPDLLPKFPERHTMPPEFVESPAPGEDSKAEEASTDMYTEPPAEIQTEPETTAKPTPKTTTTTWKPEPTTVWKEELTTWKPEPTDAPELKEYEDHDHPHDYDHNPPSAAAKSVDCSKLGVGIYADPESCTNFILCVPINVKDLGPLKMDCPMGTKFDRKLKVCNHAYLVSDC